MRQQLGDKLPEDATLIVMNVNQAEPFKLPPGFSLGLIDKSDGETIQIKQSDSEGKVVAFKPKGNHAKKGVVSVGLVAPDGTIKGLYQPNLLLQGKVPKSTLVIGFAPTEDGAQSDWDIAVVLGKGRKAEEFGNNLVIK
jgi:hypothetical protein